MTIWKSFILVHYLVPADDSRFRNNTPGHCLITAGGGQRARVHQHLPDTARVQSRQVKPFHWGLQSADIKLHLLFLDTK